MAVVEGSGEGTQMSKEVPPTLTDCNPDPNLYPNMEPDLNPNSDRLWPCSIKLSNILLSAHFRVPLSHQ